MKTRIRLAEAPLICAVALAMGCSLSVAGTFSDANWISMGGLPGADGTVLAVVVDVSGNVYIGGSFAAAGNAAANSVAKWDGSHWSALGSGLGNSSAFPHASVYALAVSGSNVYAGGSFTTAGDTAATNIAKWNGSSWSALGLGTDNAVRAIVVAGGNLYAGGSFTMADGIAANYVAKWDGSSWSALGSGMDSAVNALAVSGSDLYAGGFFTTAGGTAANDIAKWDGSSWSALGGGMNGGISALALSGSDLYAGGSFTTAGGIAATNIAKWDGSGWSALGLGLDTVYALAVSGSAVYAVNNPRGGMYPPGYVLKWDGSSWSLVGVMNGNFSGGYVLPLYSLVVSGSVVYAGGYFQAVNGTSASDIAKWDGSSWSALGSGMNGIFPNNNPSVNALSASDSEVYVGGVFTTTGGAAAANIAKWNGSGWSPLGSGIPGGSGAIPVNALALSGSDLYAGGYFTEAGGNAANYVAKWDGSSWSALGSGMGGVTYPGVSAMAVLGSNLYVGGGFTIAGGIAATNIAKWDGSGWSALGSGIASQYVGSAPVGALAVSGSDVYAGGYFTEAGGIAATNIAKWDGSGWSALGSGINGGVDALVVSGSDVYAGGNFTTAGGIAATNIAKWNGTSWSALGPGLSGFGVHALAVSGSNLFAGGPFTTAGGTAVNGIAKWDGTNWSALGSGMGGGSGPSPSVSALAISGSDLFAAGNFTTAGGKGSAYVARAIVNPPILAIEPDGFGGYFLRFSGVPGSDYRLQRAPGVSGPWTASGPLTAPASGHLEFWDVFPPPGQGFYRSVGP